MCATVMIGGIMAKYRKLGKDSAARKALIRNQVTALIQNDKIVTTLARAKEFRSRLRSLSHSQFVKLTTLKQLQFQLRLQRKMQTARDLRKLLTVRQFTYTTL